MAKTNNGEQSIEFIRPQPSDNDLYNLDMKYTPKTKEIIKKYGKTFKDLGAYDNESIARKETPIFSGVLKYFPDAIAEIARCSYISNEKHNPGTKMHWDRSKSGDELDALTRHLIEAGTMDTDGILHSTKVAWRALANLQKELESLK